MYSLLALVLIDLYECDHDRLIHENQIKEGMLKAAELMGAEVIGYSFHTFRPWGVSGTVTIAESHLAVHVARVQFCRCDLRDLWPPYEPSEGL